MIILPTDRKEKYCDSCEIPNTQQVYLKLTK